MEKLIIHHIGSRSPEDPLYVILRYVSRMMVKNPQRFTTHAHWPCSSIAVVVCVNSLVTNIRWTFVPKPEQFENRDFTLKTHQTFFVHTALEEFRNATITRRVIHIITVTSSIAFKKLRLQTLKRKVGIFKFLQFEQRLRTPFSWRISVDGTESNRRNKDALPNSLA